MDRDTFNKHEFCEIFAEAMESLSSQQIKVYNLHLLGWMNQEIAEELQIQIDQASITLYQARRKVKEFLGKQGHTPNIVHQEVLALQKQDMDLLAEVMISKLSAITGEEICDQDIEHPEVIARVGQVKDACIKAAHMERSLHRITELLGFDLPDEYRKELVEQLEEYEAAQEGLERSSPTSIDFDTIWEKALAISGQRKLPDEQITEAEQAEPLRLAAEDSSDEEKLRIRLMDEFADKAIRFGDYTWELIYRNSSSVILVFEKDDAITMDLDGCVIYLYTNGHEKAAIQIRNGSVVISFDDLGISIENYAKVEYVIRKGAEIINEGSLGNE